MRFCAHAHTQIGSGNMNYEEIVKVLDMPKFEDNKGEMYMYTFYKL